MLAKGLRSVLLRLSANLLPIVLSLRISHFDLMLPGNIVALADHTQEREIQCSTDIQILNKIHRYVPCFHYKRDLTNDLIAASCSPPPPRESRVGISCHSPSAITTVVFLCTAYVANRQLFPSLPLRASTYLIFGPQLSDRIGQHLISPSTNQDLLDYTL